MDYDEDYYIPRCKKCGRPVVYRERWSGGAAKLNATWQRGDRMGWFETSPGVFEPANHHTYQCPGKSAEEREKERLAKRRALGLEP